MTKRMMPPATGGQNEIGGVIYKAAPGTTLDVSDYVGNILASNGWSSVSTHGADSTANRPKVAGRGLSFFDTTLGKCISFDGKNWRDPATGAIV